MSLSSRKVSRDRISACIESVLPSAADETNGNLVSVILGLNPPHRIPESLPVFSVYVWDSIVGPDDLHTSGQRLRCVWIRRQPQVGENLGPHRSRPKHQKHDCQDSRTARPVSHFLLSKNTSTPQGKHSRSRQYYIPEQLKQLCGRNTPRDPRVFVAAGLSRKESRHG